MVKIPQGINMCVRRALLKLILKKYEKDLAKKRRNFKERKFL
jgi:hypothetical protein